MENPSFEEKYLYTKTLFASNFVLAMVVSERVKLVNKIDEDRTARKIYPYAKGQKF